MSVAAKSPAALKTKVKSALVEILHEEPQLFRELVEDIAFASAIEQGAKSGRVSREEILGILRGEVASSPLANHKK